MERQPDLLGVIETVGLTGFFTRLREHREQNRRQYRDNRNNDVLTHYIGRVFENTLLGTQSSHKTNHTQKSPQSPSADAKRPSFAYAYHKDAPITQCLPPRQYITPLLSDANKFAAAQPHDETAHHTVCGTPPPYRPPAQQVQATARRGSLGRCLALPVSSVGRASVCWRWSSVGTAGCPKRASAGRARLWGRGRGAVDDTRCVGRCAAGRG
jgi:hypothetical protein